MARSLKQTVECGQSVGKSIDVLIEYFHGKFGADDGTTQDLVSARQSVERAKQRLQALVPSDK